MVIRNEKSMIFSIKLLFMLHSFVKLDNTLHSNCPVSVLSVSDIKCCSTTLHFACEKQKVQIGWMKKKVS
jgi:hypothetical protein